MALADTANLVVRMSLDDKVSGALSKIQRQFSGLQRGLGTTATGVGQVGAGLLRLGAIAGTATAGGFLYAVNAAGDFEAQLNTINTVIKTTPEGLTAIGDGIREISRTTGQTTDDLTSAFYDLVSAGVSVADSQGVLNTAVQLGIGGLATTTESIDLLTTAMNAYGLDATGAAHASDIFAAAVRDGKVKVSEISASFADVAPLAATYGIKLEEIGAAYAHLTARGVPATEVGTQFNRAIVELLKPGPELVDVMDGLGDSFENLIRKQGLVATLEDIRVEAEKQGIPFQNLFGRLEAYKFALATTGENLGDFNTELTAMGDAAGETSAQFAERQQGLNFQLSRVKALVNDAAITVGEAVLPTLTPLVEDFANTIDEHRDDIASFAQDVADGFRTLVDEIGNAVESGEFQAFLDAFGLLKDIGTKVVDLFRSLPPSVQAMVVTGLAVNKLSGGLLGAGAANIGKGVIELIFQRGSSPANPLWVQSVGGIGGGAPGVGGGGGPGVVGGLLGIGAAVGGGLLAGSYIGHEAFYNPTVAPAVDYEQSTFDRALANGGVQDTVHNIGVIADAISNIESRGPLAEFLMGDQLAVLREQKRLLQEKLPILARTALETSTANARKAERDAERNHLIARQLETMAQQSMKLQQIADKKTTVAVTLNTNVFATLSTTAAAATMSQINKIRVEYGGGSL